MQQADADHLGALLAGAVCQLLRQPARLPGGPADPPGRRLGRGRAGQRAALEHGGLRQRQGDDGQDGGESSPHQVVCSLCSIIGTYIHVYTLYSIFMFIVYIQYSVGAQIY